MDFDLTTIGIVLIKFVVLIIGYSFRPNIIIYMLNNT